MTKLTLPRLDPLKGSVAAINGAFDTIEQGMENTLSRDGTAPNQMQSHLDMNGNRVINAAQAIAGSDLPTWAQVLGLAFGEVPGTIEIGEANVGQNIGAGVGIYAGKVNEVLQFKSLQAGANVTLNESGGTITISAATGGGGGADVSAITIFSVKDPAYGALGDGVTDDSGAVAAALSAAQMYANGIGTVYFPPGTYNLATLGTLTGRVMMFAHPNTATLVGNINYVDDFPRSAHMSTPLDNTTPYLSLYGLNFETPNESFALTVVRQEIADPGTYALCGQMSMCQFYGSRGFRGDSLVQFNTSDCVFYNRTLGFNGRTMTACSLSRCRFNNCNEAGILLNPDPNRHSSRDFFPGGENMRISDCEIGVCSNGIVAYKTAWMVIENSTFDNSPLPAWFEGCAELTVQQTYFGCNLSVIPTLSAMTGYVAPLVTEYCVFIRGDNDNSTGQPPSSGNFIDCRFVGYNLSGSPQTTPLVEVNGETVPDSFRGEGVSFINCLFKIQTAHQITPALLRVDGINGLRINNCRFHSFQLTVPAAPFVPYHWEDTPGVGISGVDSALGYGNDFFLCRDSADTILTAPQETDLATGSPDLSAYLTKVEAAATYRVKPLRIVVLGDSLTTFPAYNKCWPAHLGAHLVACGIDTEVHTIGQNGFTFAQAVSETIFNSQNAVNRTIALNPRLVIVSLGYNDALVNGTAAATVQSNAQTVFQALRAGLPTATILYASQVPWDSVKFPTIATAKNYGILPFLQPRESDAGVKQDPLSFPGSNYTNNFYGDTILASASTRLNNWFTADTGIRGNMHTWVGGLGVAADYTISLHLWRAFRLGLGNDSLHLKEIGQEFITGYALQHLRTNAAIQAQRPELAPMAELSTVDTRPDELWAYMLTDPGGTADYTYNYTVNGNFFTYWCELRAHDWQVNLVSWYRPNKILWIIDADDNSFDVGLGRDVFTMLMRNIPPGMQAFAKVFLSSAGEGSVAWKALSPGVYNTNDTLIYTQTSDDFKDYFNIVTIPGTYWIKVKIAPSLAAAGDIFGTFQMAITETPLPSATGSSVVTTSIPVWTTEYVRNGGPGLLGSYADCGSWTYTVITGAQLEFLFNLAIAAIGNVGSSGIWQGCGMDIRLMRGATELFVWEDCFTIGPYGWSGLTPSSGIALGQKLMLSCVIAGEPAGLNSYKLQHRITAIRGSLYSDTVGQLIKLNPNNLASSGRITSVKN